MKFIDIAKKEQNKNDYRTKKRHKSERFYGKTKFLGLKAKYLQIFQFK